MEVPSFSPLSGDGRLPLCAKRKINLRRMIFQSKPNDLQICAKRKAAFSLTYDWHGLKDKDLKVQDVSDLYWDSYVVSWKMKGIFPEKYGGGNGTQHPETYPLKKPSGIFRTATSTRNRPQRDFKWYMVITGLDCFKESNVISEPHASDNDFKKSSRCSLLT